ncbi:MAG: DUF4430 domain-containing protein [Clostridium sp.]|nr:DUF4430 domain-containing protein [Clostridium sp.]
MNIKNKRILSKVLSIILILAMTIGVTPIRAFASNNKVRVIIENSTFKSKADALSKGYSDVKKEPEWTGTLVNTLVDIDNDSTMMSCIVEALDSVDATQEGAENNYISDIDGLAAFDGGSGSGWMGTLNDWFINEGFGSYTVKSNTLQAGDEIHLMYTMSMGEDLGGSWSNNDKTLKDLKINSGILSPAFNKNTHEYTLTVPSSVKNVVVTPTAANKNFQVRTSVDGKEYKRSNSIPVKNGTVIKVTCGNPSWPTMNGGIYGTADSVPAQTYTIKVVVKSRNTLSKSKQETAKLESLNISTGSNPSTSNILLENLKDENTLEYNLQGQPDTIKKLYFKAKPKDKNDKVTIYYKNKSRDITWLSGAPKNVNCISKGKNTFTIVVTGEGKESTTYTFNIDCLPTLTNLSVKTKDTQLFFDKEFSSEVNDYTLTIPRSEKNIIINTEQKSNEYKITYNDSDSNEIDISNIDKINIKLSGGEGEKRVENTYSIRLNKVDTLGFKVQTEPKDAIVTVYDQNGNRIDSNEDGSFSGMFGTYEYSYVVTRYGYISKKGKVPSKGGQLDIKLDKAKDSTIKDLSSDWKNFRNSDNNIGITKANTPILKEDTTLLWNAKLGSGWKESLSVQIIVDNSLVVMVGTTIYKLDLKTGNELAKGEMVSEPNWGYTPPTYAEGMIFCPLSDGTIQAFDAKTLESLWVYKDEKKGQSLSPITYSDGFIYTGFWNGECNEANFVCLSVTDEDPNNKEEEKTATWKHSQLGGYYWAGSVVVNNTVVVGCDDGTSGTKGDSKLCSFDKRTGKVISVINLEGVGDQRSSIAYDEVSKRVYFTTKGGYLCSADLNKETGEVSNLKKVNCNAQSTSTPIVYKGKVYFTTGSGISFSGSSGSMVVADANTLEVLYSIGLKGYPQCSLLLSTAYEDETGYIYLYSTYNSVPGGISMVKVKPEATSAKEAELVELYDAKGFEQYCISSIICDKSGNLYYKNDSGNVFAVGIPDYKTVVNLIKKIGVVNLDSGVKIKTARQAYNSLSDEGKKKVDSEKNEEGISYTSILNESEDKYYKLKITECEFLINKIGVVTLDKEFDIKKAEEVYNALDDNLKNKISNYSILEKAVLKLKELKEKVKEEPKDNQESNNKNEEEKEPNYINDYVEDNLIPAPISSYVGDRKLITNSSEEEVNNEISNENPVMVVSQKINEILNQVDVANALPKDKSEVSDSELNNIIETYKMYEMLSDEDKPKVENYVEFESLLEEVGEAMHYDKEKNIIVENLEWYYKLEVTEQEFSNEEKEEIEKVLGKDAAILLSYNISIKNLLTGEKAHLDKSVTVKILAPNKDIDNDFVIVHINDDGKYEYIKCSIKDDYITFDTQDFSSYRVVESKQSIADLMKQDEPVKNNMFIWIIICSSAVLILIALIIYRRNQILKINDK